MKFTRIFKETSLLWPASIDVSDGQLQDGERAYFPTLTNAWGNAEINAEKWSEWHQLMVWAIFGSFHKLAREAFRSGTHTIHKKDLDLRYVESKFAENLFTPTVPGYPRQMRRAYRNDLKP